MTEPIQQFILMTICFVIITIYVVSIFTATKDGSHTDEFDFAIAILIIYLIIYSNLQLVSPQLHSMFFLGRSIFLFL